MDMVSRKLMLGKTFCHETESKIWQKYLKIPNKNAKNQLKQGSCMLNVAKP
jgi:hypothetical protein